MEDRLPIKFDRYYSTRDLANLLRVNESTVKRWADTGKIDCFKTPGGHRRYPPERVLEFISKYQYEIIPLDPNVSSRSDQYRNLIQFTTKGQSKTE